MGGVEFDAGDDLVRVAVVDALADCRVDFPGDRWVIIRDGELTYAHGFDPDTDEDDATDDAVGGLMVDVIALRAVVDHMGNTLAKVRYAAGPAVAEVLSVYDEGMTHLRCDARTDELLIELGFVQ